MFRGKKSPENRGFTYEEDAFGGTG
jgi:hypothetical protein